MTSPPLLGEASCLLASSVWAVSVAMYRRAIEGFGARAVNLTKCLVASLLFLATILALDRGRTLLSVPFRDVSLVALSGLVGLTMGDSALFAAVGRLGPYRALLLQTLAPVFTAIFALAWQREVPRGTHLAGMILTLLGVALVVSKPAASRGALSDPSHRVSGIVFGVLSAMGQGGGIVLAKAGMGTLSAMHASFVRLGTAATGLVLIGLLDGSLRRAARLSRTPPSLGRVAAAAFLGSYVGIFLMMFGIARAPAAVAAVLLSTTPVFSLFLDVARGRERFTVRNVAGTLVAVSGVAVLTL